MAILITPDGIRTEVSAKGARFTLDEMYSFLSCSLLQAVFLLDGRIMWIDEEGKFKPHRVNILATELLYKAGGLPGDYIAGAALLTQRNEVE
jgi:hypothetical protein